jgi:hypothetical protein
LHFIGLVGELMKSVKKPILLSQLRHALFIQLPQLEHNASITGAALLRPAPKARS